MRCPKCGIENPDDVKICGSCSAVLRTSTGQEPVTQPRTSRLALFAHRISFLALILFFLFIASMLWKSDASTQISFYLAFISGLFSIIGLVSGFLALPMVYLTKKLCGYNEAWTAISIGLVLIVILPITFQTWWNYRRVEFGEDNRVKYNFKMLGKSIEKYANDNYGLLPETENWCNKLITYDGSLSKDAFRGRYNEDGDCQVAFNENISRLRFADIPGNTVLLFEASGDWNLSGGKQSLGLNQKTDFAFLLFVDGTIGRYQLSSGEITLFDSNIDKTKYIPLKWKP